VLGKAAHRSGGLDASRPQHAHFFGNAHGAFLLFFLPCRDWYFVPYFSFL